mgnify:FL=1
MTLSGLEQSGISLKAITDDLVREGVAKFAGAFDKLFATIAHRRRVLIEGEHPRLDIAPGSAEMSAAIKAEMEAWRKDGRIRRLWAGDTSLWSGTDENKWLGWLDVAERELADLDG